MTEFRINGLQTETIDPNPNSVVAQSPERAAEIALDLSLVRSGAKHNLRAQVYCQHPGKPVSMVRLFTKVAEHRPGGNSNAR